MLGADPSQSGPRFTILSGDSRLRLALRWRAHYGIWCMRTEIVLDQYDFLSVGEAGVQLLENVGIIDGRVPIRDFHMPPAFQRSEHHEQIGCAVALVFVIMTRG